MLMKKGTKRRPSKEKKLLLALLFAQIITVLVAMPTAQDTSHEGRRHAVDEDDGRGRGGEEGGSGWKGGAVPEVVVVPKKKTQKHEARVVRHLKLLNRCSQKHLRLTSKYVDAKGSSDNIYSHLRVVSEEFGSRLRIQSAQTLNYLCFNKRGKLIVKHSGKDDGCIFREIYSRNHFTEFQSTVNVTWFLAFRSNGRAMDGGVQWQRRHPSMTRCRQFAKIPFFRPDDDDYDQLSRDTTRTRHGPPLRGNIFAPRRDHQVLLVRTPDEKRRRIAETDIRSSRDRRPPEVVDRMSPDGARNEEEKKIITETPIARGRSRQER